MVMPFGQPELHPESMRLQIAFLFPKLSKDEEIKMMEHKLKELKEQPQQKN